MNEKLLMKFVEWLPTKFEELEGKSPEEIVAVVNNMASSDEGKAQLEQLIKQFQSESVGTFKKGGKLDYFVTKFAKGGYNRAQARDNKKDAGLYNEEGVRNKFDKGNLSAKVAKAKAVDGYENRSFITNFDRSEYRRRKRELKQSNPEMTRRERKAEALTRHIDIPVINQYLAKKTAPLLNIDIPEFNEDLEGPELIKKKPRGIVEVGPIDWEILPDSVPEEPRTKAVSWSQFANEVFDHIRQNSANHPTQDNQAVQGYIWDQYQKYSKNPDNYVYTPMTSADVATQRAKAVNGRYSQKAIGLVPSRGAGYYDPDLHAVAFNAPQQTLPESQ